MPSWFGMNTLGFGPHHSLTTPPPKFQWIISFFYQYFRGTFLSACFLPDAYILCQRCTLYFLVAMIVFMMYIHILLSRGYNIIDDMDPPCILSWPWSNISYHGSTVYFLASMLIQSLSMST
jgi:hypothetical protein